MNSNFTNLAVKTNNPCTYSPSAYNKILLEKLFVFNITILFSTMTFMAASAHDILFSLLSFRYREIKHDHCHILRSAYCNACLFFIIKSLK